MNVQHVAEKTLMDAGPAMPRGRSARVLAAVVLLASSWNLAAQETEQQYCERQPDHVREVCLRELERTRTNAAPAAAMVAPAAEAESERQYCERQAGHVREICLRELAKTAARAAPAATAAAPSGGAETDRQYCERQPDHVRTICLRELDKPGAKAAGPAAATSAVKPAVKEAPTPATADAGAKPYQVKDGFHVDAQTYKGFKTWRAAACDRFHGPNQEGLVGPSLIESMKILTRAEFKKVVTEGRLVKGMPAFSTNKMAMANLDALYAYLKGRSDGAITKAHVEPMLSQ